MVHMGMPTPEDKLGVCCMWKNVCASRVTGLCLSVCISVDMHVPGVIPNSLHPAPLPSSLRLSHYSDICARHVPARSNLLRRN